MICIDAVKPQRTIINNRWRGHETGSDSRTESSNASSASWVQSRWLGIRYSESRCGTRPRATSYLQSSRTSFPW